MLATTWADDGSRGANFSVGEIPDGLREAAVAARAALIETLAVADEELFEAYVDGIDLQSGETAELVRGAIRRACLAGRVVPVLAGSAFKNKGVQPLLDAVVAYLPWLSTCVAGKRWRARRTAQRAQWRLRSR
jgi:elongation factor G